MTTTPHTAPAGTANRRTRRRNPGWYRRLFGPSARKNAGMPIVTADTRVRCRGRNGNGSANAAAVTMAMRLMTFFATKRLATRSTLLMTRRPSASTDGRCENLPSSSTSCATALVACAPLFIATPMSASLIASASLTPSPVIATTWPSACSAWTRARFCSGLHPAEDRRLSDDRAQLLDVGTDGPGVAQPAVGDVEADPAGDRADGLRVVAGDDLDVDALRREVVQRVLGVGPDLLGQRHQRERAHPGGQDLPVEGGVAVAEQHAPAGRSSPSRGPVRAAGRPRRSSTSGAPRT